MKRTITRTYNTLCRVCWGAGKDPRMWMQSLTTGGCTCPECGGSGLIAMTDVEEYDVPTVETVEARNIVDELVKEAERAIKSGSCVDPMNILGIANGELKE